MPVDRDFLFSLMEEKKDMQAPKNQSVAPPEKPTPVKPRPSLRVVPLTADQQAWAADYEATERKCWTPKGGFTMPRREK